MLVEDYPIVIDNTEVPIKKQQWNRSYVNVSNIAQTEAGTDDVEVLRFGKTTISASFKCTDTWAKFFAECNGKPYLTVKFYDLETETYAEKTMRMDSLTINEIRFSDRIDVSNGLYNVSFRLLEF